jgi:hypothetical protein
MFIIPDTHIILISIIYKIILEINASLVMKNDESKAVPLLLVADFMSDI